MLDDGDTWLRQSITGAAVFRMEFDSIRKEE
jgi:hypothetical protein